VILRSTETAKSAYGLVDASGQYSIELPQDKSVTSEQTYDVLVVEDATRGPTISAKYQDPKKSGLRVTVTPGNSVQLNVTADPP
jgi:hypothetical protein